MNNNLGMLIRREFWENRSLWIAPLVLAGVIVILAAFGGVHFNNSGNFWFGTGAEPGMAMGELSDAEREELLVKLAPNEEARLLIVSGVFGGLVTVQLFTLGIVVFFYLLDCLLTERRDRSILFWKSLPISDGEVVTSKALAALVVAPLFVVLVNAVMLLVVPAVLALRLDSAPFTAWSADVYFHVLAITLAFVPMVIIWYLPVAGYLMLISVWVRKNAFLWAVLPPVGILLIEGMITHTDYMANFLGARFGGFGKIMDFSNTPDFGPNDFLKGAFTYIGRVFGDWHIWAGAAAGFALIYLAVRIRRLRDES